MRSSKLILALALLSTSVPAPVAAQFSQYTAPGSLLERSTTTREQMENAIDNARWRFGPLRLSPWFAVRDAAFVSDVFSGSSDPEGAEEESDFTISVGAGLQGFVPFGSKTFLTIDALPQYVWWQELEERRRLNGYYGAGLFGLFNRLTAEATVRRAEEQGVVTPEFEQRIHTRQDRLAGLLEVEVTPTFYVFASGDFLDYDTLVEDLGDDPRLPPFEQLDREERVLRGGVELRRDELRVAAGIERSEVDFDPLESGRDRSNSGTSPILEAGYDGPRFQLDANVAFRSLEPEPGSEFVAFDETTGEIRGTLTPRWRLSYSAYAGRGLTYSLEEEYSHFTSDRLGFAVISKIGKSSAVNLFVENGAYDYQIVQAGALPRQDDFMSYGTSLQLQFRETLRITLGVIRTETDSNLPGLDRSLTTFQTSIELSAFGGAFTLR